MRLFHKLVIVVSIPVLLIWVVAFYSTQASSESLRTSIAQNSSEDALALMDEIDRILHNKVSTWLAYSSGDAVQGALKTSNEEYEAMEDIEDFIASKDSEWQSKRRDNPSQFMLDIQNTRLSHDLRSLADTLADLNVEKTKVYGEIFITNRFGVNIAMTGMTSDFRQNDEEWWQQAWEKGIYVADVQHDESSDVDSIDICIRIDDANQNRLGVLKAVVNIEDLVTVVDERAEDKTVILFSSDRRIIKNSSELTTSLDDGSFYFSELDNPPDEDRTQVVWNIDAATGDKMLFAYAFSDGYASFPGLGWCVLVKYKAEKSLQPMRRLVRDIHIFAVFASVLALLISGGLAVWLSRRIEQIADATHKVSRGELDTQLPDKGSDEIAHLARSFNMMTEDLERFRTAQKHSNEQLRKATEQARAANTAKDEFLANMSHEIRTPMNAIIGMTEFVLDSDVDEQQRRNLSIIMESADSLMTIINEILDYSKIEAGKVELDPAPLNLADCLANALHVVAGRANKKGLELICDIDEKIPDSIVGDSVRLKQVVVNLIGNAIKFTASGQIVLGAELKELKSNRAIIYISVSDTGIGIPADKQTSIFEAFQQADGSTTRQYGGTGLGLSISHQLVGLMGGNLEVKSEEGSGSTFFFTIECDVVPDEGDGDAGMIKANPEILKTIKRSKVLVVDDNTTSGNILKRILSGLGGDVTYVDGGEQAISLFHSNGKTPADYDVILVDLHMPEPDGFHVLEFVRGHRETKQPKVIVMTSGESAEVLARLDQIGVDSMLYKPFKPSDVVAAVSRALDRIGSPDSNGISTEVQEEFPSIRPLQVLLAEDGIANQVLAKSLLERWGHRVTVVENGLLAVKAVQEKQFDLVLMDVQMPIMDGLQATREIRELEKNSEQKIPIIALTARAMQGDRKTCEEAGMDGYLSKPFRQADFHTVIAGFFQETASE